MQLHRFQRVGLIDREAEPGPQRRVGAVHLFLNVQVDCRADAAAGGVKANPERFRLGKRHRETFVRLAHGNRPDEGPVVGTVVVVRAKALKRKVGIAVGDDGRAEPDVFGRDVEAADLDAQRGHVVRRVAPDDEINHDAEVVQDHHPARPGRPPEDILAPVVFRVFIIVVPVQHLACCNRRRQGPRRVRLIDIGF